MKKNGFTLAEVLITLSIIGVVAALTLPSLNMGVQSSKVGPHLRKFINTITNANEMILTENQSNSLRSIYDEANNGAADYLAALSGQVRGAATNSTIADLADDRALTNYGPNGAAFVSNNVVGVGNINVTQFDIFNFDSGESLAIGLRAAGAQQRDNVSGGHRGVFADVIYDMDGFGTGANKLGIDLFMFRMDNNGSLIPAGSTAEASAGYVNHSAAGHIVHDSRPRWRLGDDRCNVNGNQLSMGTGVNCAGSVADNNWRVIYQY